MSAVICYNQLLLVTQFLAFVELSLWLKVKIIVSVLSALALWVWIQLGSFSWEIAPFKTEELLFDLKPKTLLRNLEYWVLAPLIKCRGYKVWPRIPPCRFIRHYWRNKPEEDNPEILNATIPLSSAQVKRTQARCSGPGVLYLLQVIHPGTSVASREGRTSLVLITDASLALLQWH